MFRFRFKFLADSYLLLFSFFLGMIGAALFFWWRYPVFPSYLFYSYGITGNKNFTEAFLIVIKQRFFQLGAGWLCGLTVYSVWLFGILTCFWSFSLGMVVIYFTLEKGLWGLPDHVILELLLFYALPRVDTNDIAHRLIRRFGSLQRVFDADPQELIQVPGVGENAALLLKFIPALTERYSLSKLKKGADFSSLEKAADFFMDFYASKTKETVCALLLDNSDHLISFEKLHEGSVNSAEINPRKIVEIAFLKKASSLILAHNHPAGNPVPSTEDVDTTRHLMDAFLPLNLHIRAHFVVADGRYTDILPQIYDHARFEVKYIAVNAKNPEKPAPVPEEPPVPEGGKK